MNLILIQALENSAREIFLEPYKKDFRVRYRIKDSLYEMPPIAIDLGQSMIERLKIIAGIKVDDSLVGPQIGDFIVKLTDTPITFSLTIFPGTFGETAVIEIFERDLRLVELDKLSLFPADRHLIQAHLPRPGSSLIIIAPKGEGKSTTYYSILNELSRENYKIFSLERRLAINLPGITQIETKESSTFRKPLHRISPDVVALDPVDDEATAGLFVEKILDGSRVIATVEADDVVRALQKFVAWGVDRHVLLDLIDTILWQRTLRKTCPECKLLYRPGESSRKKLRRYVEDPAALRLYAGIGCWSCDYMGCKGTAAILEVIRLDRKLRWALAEWPTRAELQKLLKALRIRTIEERAIRALREGWVSFPEAESLID